MSHFRRSRKPSKQSHNFAVQAEPPLDIDSFGPGQSAELTPVTSSLVKKEKVQSLLSTIEKVENESKIQKEQEERKRRERTPVKKGVDINMMKIRDESYKLQKNIFNVTVGQLLSKESKEGYLNDLSTKINQLKTKIHKLEEEQEKINMTIEKQISLQHRSVDFSDRSMTINSNQCRTGKIYHRNQTPSTSRRFKGGNTEEKSSYYKWRPDVEQQELAVQDRSLPHQQPMKNTRYFEQSSPSQAIKDDKDKSYINYRVKQKSKAPLSAKAELSQAGSSNQRNSKQMIRLDLRGNIKTEQVSQQTQKTENNPEDDKRSKTHKLSEAVQLEKYDGILFGDVSEYEIKDLSDDFRKKVTQQLSIPKGFPVKQPQLGLTIQEFEALGPKIYEIFGIQVQKEKNKLKCRKFKNGVYFHLNQHKNVLWYYSGSFYIGGWDSQLPIQGQKTGMGFQYIPDKYYYRGQFKDGVKEGKGVVRLFPSNPEKPNSFMAYEGEWKNGKPHGFGKHIDEKDTKYIGFFEAGEKTGHSTIITKQGLWYQGDVLKGIKHGFGTQKLVNGDCFVGQFQNGNFHGQGSYKWKNGSTYQGQFFKGKRQGKGVWKGTNGDKFEGEYHSDLKNGWGKFIWTNGEIYQGEFKNDVRHGEGSYKHPNGKLGTFMWKEGQIDYRIYSKEQQHYRCRKIEDRSNEELQQ